MYKFERISKKMMPTELKLTLQILIDLILLGGLGYVIWHIYKYPKEWFFWRNDEDDDEEEDDDNNF